ncbi:hypothetical protein [Rhodocista pekingensis]|uniref:Uncharacterized protein n=1 Tax=Rhodocista pekingensis TaxID=201185 RepID=A0ABW2L064_9PROT
MPAYTRFLDIHLIHSSGWYDMARDIAPMAVHQRDRHGLVPQCLLTIPQMVQDGGGVVAPKWSRIRKDTGYVAIAVPVPRVAKALPGDALLAVEWVCAGGHVGKIRINGHGDGRGGMEARNARRQQPEQAGAERLVAWLAMNGLKTGTPVEGRLTAGLTTLALSFCFAGRGDGSGGANGAGALNPGPNSAVAVAVETLRERGFLGVEVTGSNEMVSLSLGRFEQIVDRPALLGVASRQDVWRTEDAWTFQNRQGGGAEIRVPPDLTVRPGDGDAPARIEIPAHYRAVPVVPDEPDGGWYLLTPCYHLPPGWRVVPGTDGRPDHIPLPTGFAPATGEDAANRLVNPNATAEDDGREIVELLSHSAVKVRAVS